MDNIFDYWPKPEFTPRINQEKALNRIANSDAKYFILEAPVGSGKSLIALTASKFMHKPNGSSFILTPQRILQTQYENDFKELGNGVLTSLHGKANYTCNDKHASCAIGSIIKPRCKYCPYQHAKTLAKNSANTVLNYKLALTSFEYTDIFKPRTLMIMDEAHTLEKHLVEFDSVNITYARCKRYKLNFQVNTTLSKAIEWIKTYYLPKIQIILSDLEEECESLYDKNPSKLTKSDINKIKEVDDLTNHVTEVLELSIYKLDYLNEKFVLVHDKTTIQFKRITGAYSFNKIIKPKGIRFLFMSSTILNYKAFCADLGIDNNEAEFLSLDSDFPVENRPVYYLPVMKMNASWKNHENENLRKNMITRLIQLLNAHKNESGIVHTANYEIATWLFKELNNKIPHNIHAHNPDLNVKRNDAINLFMEDIKPSILISPSSTEGLDLKDDLGRFAIIVKTPFGYLGDQWIKRRMEMSMEWYRRRAMTDIIQGGGRIVRSDNDKGNVYILDESFGYLYNQSLSMVPNWWKESLKYT